MFNKYRISVRDDEKVLKTDSKIKETGQGRNLKARLKVDKL